MKKWFSILLVIAMFVSCAACGDSTSKDNSDNKQNTDQIQQNGSENTTAGTVKLGVLLPLSGSTATSGQYQLEGMQMAVDYVNENGGIKSMNGAQVELVVSDTTGDIETGITEIERLITVENVSALCGPFNSTVGAATAPIAIQYQTPYVITNAIADNIMQNGANKYVYRVNFGAADMVPFRSLYVEYLGSLTDAGKLQKVAVVYDASDWGTSEYEAFSTVAQDQDIEIVYSEALALDVADLSSVVNKIKSSGAEVVLAGISLNTAVLLTKTMNEYNCDAQLVGSGTGFADPAWLEAVGNEAAENVLGTTAFNPKFGTKNDEAQALYESYMSEHSTQMPEETINGFCGMATILVALEDAGSAEREAIADALYALDLDSDSMPLWFTMFDGVKFGVDGDEYGRYNQNTEVGATSGQIMQQCINGSWELVWPTEQATADIQF